MTESRSRGVPENVLLASDLTPACDRAFDRAFDRAAEHASEWRAVLTVLHVIEAPSLRLWSVAPRLKQAETEIERLVRDSQADLKHGIISHVVVGDPAERVVAKAQDGPCDLIVTGRGHDGTLGAKLLGSTPARILRHCDHPVLIVQRRRHGPYQRIAVAVDFSPPSRHALDCAVTLFPKAFFTVVHAYEMSAAGSGQGSSLRAVEMRMADFLRQTDPESSLHMRLERGAPAAVMAEYVRKHAPDLVVVGTHGRTGAQRDFTGSVAEALLRSLPCDVLSVRAACRANTGNEQALPRSARDHGDAL